MSTQHSVETLRQLLIEQVNTLTALENAETQRLAVLLSDKPDMALQNRRECEALFGQSVQLQAKIDEMTAAVQNSSEAQALQELTELRDQVKAKARRALTVTRKSQDTLQGMLDLISGRVTHVRTGKKALRSYDQRGNPAGNRLSGKL